MRAADIPELAKLSTEEKILFLEDLWDSIAADALLPVPKSHRDELDRRDQRHQDSPGELLTLDELRARIER